MHAGDNIRALRKREGYSQMELAARLGVSKETVCRWETGKSLPRQRHIAELIDQFPLSQDDLLSIDNGLAAQELLHGIRKGALDHEQTPEARPIYRIGASGGGYNLVSVGKALVPSDVHQRHPDTAFIRLDGNEMSRLYPQGALLLVDSMIKPWNGCTVAALIDNKNVVIRRFSSGNNTVLLSSHSYSSPDPDIMVDKRRVRIIGVVVWFQAARDLDGH